MKEAKEKKVFLDEYLPSQRKLNINDSIYIINEAWSEHLWMFVNEDGLVKKQNGNCFMVKFEKMNQNIKYEWIYKKQRINSGIGWTNDGLLFNLETTLDTIRLDFLTKKDTIPVYFIRKK